MTGRVIRSLLVLALLTYTLATSPSAQRIFTAAVHAAPFVVSLAVFMSVAVLLSSRRR